MRMEIAQGGKKGAGLWMPQTQNPVTSSDSSIMATAHSVTATGSNTTSHAGAPQPRPHAVSLVPIPAAESFLVWRQESSFQFDIVLISPSSRKPPLPLRLQQHQRKRRRRPFSPVWTVVRYRAPPCRFTFVSGCHCDSVAVAANFCSAESRNRLRQRRILLRIFPPSLRLRECVIALSLPSAGVARRWRSDCA